MPPKLVGRFRFDSRKDAEAEIRRILHEAPLDVPLAGDERDLIEALIGLHPEAADKIGVGIQSVHVAVIDYGSRGFWVTRTDGSMCDVSYRKALTGAPANLRQQIHAALRMAVREDVNEFRRQWFAAAGDNPICPLTGQRLTLGPSSHVDHIDPQFADIADEFIALCNGVDNITIGSSPHHPGPAVASDVVRVAWIIHHRLHAHLRVVHGSANLARRSAA